MPHYNDSLIRLAPNWWDDFSVLYTEQCQPFVAFHYNALQVGLSALFASKREINNSTLSLAIQQIEELREIAEQYMDKKSATYSALQEYCNHNEDHRNKLLGSLLSALNNSESPDVSKYVRI